MNIKQRANELAKSITLTSDDKKRFEPRGSFAQQVVDSIGKTLCMVDSDLKTVTFRNGQVELTVLKFAELENETNRSKLTCSFDFQNIYLSGDDKKSLQRVGELEGGETAVQLMASFVVDKVDPTGIYPMKYSLAAQELGFVIGRDYSEGDWASVRAKYKDEAMKVARTDNTDDISWLEIQHIFISPIE